MKDKEIVAHVDRLHTTEMGRERIRRHLNLDVDDVVAYCKQKICDPHCQIERRGKNWYCEVDDVRITVNAGSYTIITAHMVKGNR